MNYSSVAYLDASYNGEQERRYNKETSKSGNWVIDRLVEKPSRVAWVSLIVGIFSGAIGITLYINSRGILSGVGFILLFLGLLSPVFPWWIIVVDWWG